MLRVVVVVVVAVAAAVVMVVEAGKIYYPGNLDEVREDIAIRRCLRDPTCVLPSHHRARERCKVDGAALDMVNEIMEETRMKITTRTGGGGGGGSCNRMAGEVVWPATGECVVLLTQGPCPFGQWVKLQKNTFKPVCEPQPCTLGQGRGRGGGRGGGRHTPLLGTGAGVILNGTCYLPSELPSSIRCPSNEEAVTNEHGEVECDCRPGFVYYGADNTCYEPYTRGPCLPGYVIRVEDSDSSGRALCFPNECPEEGMVVMNSSCHALNTRSSSQDTCYPIGARGPCDSGTIIVDTSLSMPICLTTHSIFSDAVLRCPRGSRRDLFGRCRTVFDRFLSNVPVFSTARPGGTSVCPSGFFFAAGTCLRKIT